MSDSESETLAVFSAEMMKMLGVKTIDLDAPMSQLGVDSLNVVEMVVICQQIYTSVTNYQDIQIDENTTIRELDAQLHTLSAA
jgi:hypothetical protein